MEDAEFEALVAEAEKIGTEHGRNAGSWVVDGNTSDDVLQSLADAIDADELLDYLDLSGPFSGEYADGYSVEQLVFDVGGPEDFSTEDGDYGVAENLAAAYEYAYWMEFEATVRDQVAALRADEESDHGRLTRAWWTRFWSQPY